MTDQTITLRELESLRVWVSCFTSVTELGDRGKEILTQLIDQAAAPTAGAEDTRRLDLVSEFLDGVRFEHDEDGNPRPVLDWFVGDGSGHWQSRGATWREAIDKALIRWYGDAAMLSHPDRPEAP